MAGEGSGSGKAVREEKAVTPGRRRPSPDLATMAGALPPRGAMAGVEKEEEEGMEEEAGTVTTEDRPTSRTSSTRCRAAL
ncbi:hypothetical protein U9M48_031152 [Paspalum notatum var. saurae]|uniref:Uncharacterized protein n=1 Tax=Paspalum notatum var. saurae TaxID=547442 RepID=A0AAQ3U6A7_PASNO